MITNSLNRLMPVLSIMLLCPLAAMAQGPVVVEEVIVTADPLSDVDNHFIQPTQVLNGDDLKKRSIQNIGETVSRELGVTSSDFGAGVGRPIIRGLGGGRVKVLEDSISTMDASTVSNDHAVTTEPVFAEQIEILRGPATLLYGSGASGGLINVVNNRIPERVPETVEGNVIIQYESVNKGKTGAAEFNAGGSNIALHLGGMKRDTNNYSIHGFADTSPGAGEQPGEVENSKTESENVDAGASYITDNGFIGLAISGLNSDYGIPGEGATVALEQVRYDFKASVDNPIGGIHGVNSRWGYNDYAHDEIEANGDIGTSFSNEELEGRIEIIHEPLGGWNGVFGTQINRRDFSAIGEEAFLPLSEQDSISVFLLEKSDFGRWHVDLGLRYEDQDSSASTGVSVDHGVISVGGGINFDYNDSYQLGVSVGRSQRAPAIEELFANGPHLASNSFEIGDAGLEDETSTNIDLHWHKTGGRFTFKVNLFYNLIDDFIYQQEQDLNGDGVADRVEVDFSGDIAEILDPAEDEEPLLLFNAQRDAEFLGLETESVISLIDDNRGSLDMRLWGDYVQGKLKSGGHLPRISPWRIGASLDFNKGPLSLSLDHTHVAEQGDTAALEVPTEGYDLLNIYAGYTFEYGETRITLFARGSNLLDEEIRRHTSLVKDIAPLPGRSGIVGIRAAF